jgi:hypothetical protein
LTSHRTQLVLGNIQPASMLGCVAELQATHNGPRFLRIERFVKSTFGMRVQIVADQDDFFRRRISGSQQLFDFDRPVDFGPPLPARSYS